MKKLIRHDLSKFKEVEKLQAVLEIFFTLDTGEQSRTLNYLNDRFRTDGRIVPEFTGVLLKDNASV